MFNPKKMKLVKFAGALKAIPIFSSSSGYPLQVLVRFAALRAFRFYPAAIQQQNLVQHFWKLLNKN
jgi:hypothetical protein